MDTINFPTVAAIGDVFTINYGDGNIRSWRWDGTSWVEQQL